ncbi:LacI family DNA-binding transcriptional regulator [Ahrensia kielensis]|uniref:LacI family DNA-binding transcriptional regulator n=1 Tax=Ahrensia kielensis TaxID=76980 RepID=UPI0003757C67|nr:LacI family DNA-binding transcriptional regulator [Ahrensia kielensis]
MKNEKDKIDLADANFPTAKHATLADVARHANVSAMTVSKVLRGVGSISKDTRARVKASAEALGYVTNGIAGALSAKKNTTVGIVIPSISDSVYSEIISALSDSLTEAGLTLLISESNFSGQIEERQIRMIMSLRPAALIVTGGIERSISAEKLLKRYPAPILQLWDADNPFGDATIGPSHLQAGRIAAEHFLKSGLNKIAYVGAELSKDICARLRLEAFRERLAEENIALECFVDEASPRQAASGETLVNQMISSGYKPNAIFFLNDSMALGGLRALLKYGIKVPDEVSVLGFNGTSRLNTVQTQLTTISMDRRAIGTTAGVALRAILDGKKPEKIPPTKLHILSGTTG